MSAESADVIVVGGGVIGSAAAYFLAREGLRVSLLERGEVAGEASGVAAGMLTPVGEVAASHVIARFGLECLDLFPGFCERLRDLSGIDPEFERSGVLRVATTRREMEALRKLGAEVGATNAELELEWLGAADAEGFEPGLAPGSHGALWSPTEAHVRSHLLTKALVGAARALGAQVEEGVSVQGLLRSGDDVLGVQSSAGERSAAHVILCCGPWAPELSNGLFGSESIPVVPVRGQILALDAPTPALRRIVWGGDTYIVPKRDGSVLVGATEEDAGFDRRTTAEGVNQLLAGGSRLLPALAHSAFREAQVGLRPGSPDGMPIIAPAARLRGLALASGHFRNGILLAPITGRLLAEIVLGKADPETLAEFSPERFAI